MNALLKRPTLNFLHIMVLICCAQMTTAAGLEKTMKITQPPISVPRTQFFDGSRQITLNIFRGHFIIVNFWATWCTPCMMEMPSLDRLARRMAKNNVKVIAISQDDGGAVQVQPFIDRLNLTKLHVLYDLEKKSSRDFAIRGLPTTVLLSPEGQILARLEGEAQWDKGPLFEQISKITNTFGK